MVEHQRAPGVGLLAGWRGADGSKAGVGEPNPDQLQRYIDHGCFWRHEVPAAGRYYKMANRDYLAWSKSMGFVGSGDPIVLQLYSEHLQRFRLAALGHGPAQPPASERERVARYFDPLPIWYEPFEMAQVERERYPLAAITQRPMFMYHAWGSQNRWLRQIATRNFLYLHPDTARACDLADDDWADLESHHGRITMQVKLHTGVEAGTVWTWNAIGKRRGAWSLAADAPEGSRGFLLNHTISDLLPNARYANADPVTGQAAWYDLRVRVTRAAPDHADLSQPQFSAIPSAHVAQSP
jgi:anaerobic selenocysteine-containing dehydrogenase